LHVFASDNNKCYYHKIYESANFYINESESIDNEINK